MKKRYVFLTALLLISAVIYSCKKNALQTIDQKLDASQAQIKYFNFGINAPSMNFYANGVKVSAIANATGTESTAGTTYGAVYPSSNYSLLSAASYTINGQIPSTAATDANLAILTTSSALTSGKFYTLYACGFYNTATKMSDVFVLEDKLPDLDYTVAYVRFVNTVPNAPSTLSLYARNSTTLAETLIGASTGVNYKAGSDFVSVPVGVYELYARYPAAPTVNVISRNGTTNGTVSFVGGKVYTIGARGDITVTSPTATNRPLLDNTANR